VRALLDVNVLIALLDAAHVDHDRASRWLAAHLRSGWASSPITQNGCIRIMAQPGYPSPLPAQQVAIRLADATADASHRFWPDSVSLLERGRIDWAGVLGPRQVTDAYLLALAVEQGGSFATFDRRIDIRAVRGAKSAHLVVVE
jgi:hypothetical protein